MPNRDEINQAIQVFEKRLNALNLTEDKKRELRNEFYKNILKADIETVFKIAKDEQGRDIKEILDLVRNVNQGDDDEDLGMLEKRDLIQQQQDEDKFFDEKDADDLSQRIYELLDRRFMGKIALNNTFRKGVLLDIITGRKEKPSEKQLIILEIINFEAQDYFNIRGIDFNELQDKDKYIIYTKIFRDINNLSKQKK
jgi:hypothetical protein